MYRMAIVDALFRTIFCALCLHTMLLSQEEDCSLSDAGLDIETYYSFNDDEFDGIGSNSVTGDGHSNLGLGDGGRLFNNNEDPEYFAYECLTVENAEKAMDDQVAIVCNACKVCF